jgi:hypothetical protein
MPTTDRPTDRLTDSCHPPPTQVPLPHDDMEETADLLLPSSLHLEIPPSPLFTTPTALRSHSLSSASPATTPAATTTPRRPFPLGQCRSVFDDDGTSDDDEHAVVARCVHLLRTIGPCSAPGHIRVSQVSI